MFRTAQFDKLLDKATSNLRLDTDWPTIIQICDLIRQNDCSAKHAVGAIKKKLYSPNPHQAMFALIVLESIVKNCGSVVHDEIASKTNCEMLRELVKTTQHENLRSKTLELIQAWAFAFRNTPKYRAVQDTVNILKTECYKFPPLKESDAMFSSDSAPEWSDGDVCHRCRTGFTMVLRKHHCRACGQVFCQQCSSKTSTIPKFGIEKEVRVCDACFDKVSRPPSSSGVKMESIDTSSDYGPAVQSQKVAGGKTAEELQEEEELQLALALSQSEAEQKEKSTRKTANTLSSVPRNVSPSPPSVSASPEHLPQTESGELSRYLDRGYWEQRQSTTQQHQPPQARVSSNDHAQQMMTGYSVVSKSLEDGPVDTELEDFVSALKSQIEIFVNRMKSDSSRGRSIANDTSVQTLFMNITAMHSRLLRHIQQQDDKRVHYESLQDKVSQTRDSRAALDTLRAEHAARLAAAAEAAERQKQLQMAHKLHMMRKKKHEYLQYQRQLALQRVQEQEREMQMRQEQQKQQYLISSGGYFIQPPVNYQHPFQHQQVFPNPQFHQAGLPDQAGQMNQQQMNQAMSRQNNPQGQMPPQMMMHQLRMTMPVQGAPGQPGAPPQSPVTSSIGKQGPLQQVNPQVQLGQVMGPGGMVINVPMGGVRAPGMQPGPMPIQQIGPHGQNMPPSGQIHGPQGQMIMHNQAQPGAPPMPGQVPQPGHQIPPQNPQIHQGQQIPLQGQQMTHQGQPISQGQQMQSQNQQINAQGQQMPPQNQQITNQAQQMPPQPQQMPPQSQQMPPQSQQMPPQSQQIPPQAQQMPLQSQQIPPQSQQMGPQVQQMHGQQIPQGQQMQLQSQAMPPQGQNASSPQVSGPGQQQIGHHVPNQQQTQNISNFGSPQQGQAPQVRPAAPQQSQGQQISASAPAPASAPQKSENPTAELISFD